MNVVFLAEMQASIALLFINHFNTCDVRPTTSSQSHSANNAVANGLQCCDLLRPLIHGRGYRSVTAIHIPRSGKFEMFFFSAISTQLQTTNVPALAHKGMKEFTCTARQLIQN